MFCSLALSAHVNGDGASAEYGKKKLNFFGGGNGE